MGRPALLPIPSPSKWPTTAEGSLLIPVISTLGGTGLADGLAADGQYFVRGTAVV